MKNSRKLAVLALALLALVLLAAVNVQPALAHPSTFADVDESDAAHQAIETLAAKGVVAGFAGNAFAPSREVTRGQAAKMLTLWRTPAATEAAAAPLPFSDVDRPAADSVGAACEAGWMSGYPDGTFRPLRPLTREQMAIAVVRSLGLEAAAEGLTVYQVDTALDGFVDKVAVSAGARRYVALALRKGLLAGDSGRLYPLDGVTRAQFCLVLARADAQPAAALKATYTKQEQALAGFIDTTLLEPHDSPITGTMVLQTAARYGVSPLAQLVILAAETSLGDPELGGPLARRNNFGCLRYHGADTVWGRLANGRVWVAGKDWYSFATPAIGMAAFGRYLKAAKDGFYLDVLSADRPDWGRFAAVYYGRGVSGFSRYVARLHSLERRFREQAAERGVVF